MNNNKKGGLLAPDRYVSSFRSIDPAALRAQGIRLLLLDVDNTLVCVYTPGCPPDLARFAARCKAHGVDVVLVTNNTRAHFERVMKDHPGLDTETFCCKPLPFRLRAICRRRHLQPAQCAIAGDQLFTDILGGNLLGMQTILSHPVSKEERPDTRIVRKAENLVYDRLEKKGVLKRGNFDD